MTSFTRVATVGLTVFLSAAFALANDIVQNGNFEDSESAVVSQAIVGWTTYGAPKAAIAVERPEANDGNVALRVSRGKAFCYGLPVDPKLDYRLSFRVKTVGARSRIEIHPPVADHTSTGLIHEARNGEP